MTTYADITVIAAQILGLDVLKVTKSEEGLPALLLQPTDPLKSIAKVWCPLASVSDAMDIAFHLNFTVRITDEDIEVWAHDRRVLANHLVLEPGQKSSALGNALLKALDRAIELGIVNKGA